MKKQRVKQPKPLIGKELVNEVLNALHEALAEEIVVIDLHGLPGAADHFVICQCDTSVHNRACADRVTLDLALRNTRPWQREGLEEGRWILLDYSDVIVHIMLPELRRYYNLEGLWGEGAVKRESKQPNNKAPEQFVPLISIPGKKPITGF